MRLTLALFILSVQVCFGAGFSRGRAGFSGGSTVTNWYAERFNPILEHLNYGMIDRDGMWAKGTTDPEYFGAPCSIINTTRPAGVRFQGVNNRTYIVFGSSTTTSGIFITYYDHVTGLVGTRVKIANQPVVGDPHCVPAITIDASGYLYVFYGMETSAFYMQRSTNPEDITAWDAAVTISAANEQYAQPFITQGTNLIVFYRHKVSDSPYIKSWGFNTSTNWGTNWTGFTTVIQFSDPSNIYAVSAKGSDDSLHLAWANYYYVSATNNVYTNCYYAYSTNLGVNWMKRDGTDIVLPITESTADIVLNTGAEQDWVNDIVLDPANAPYILNLVGTRTSSVDNRGTYSFKFHKYDSGWTTTVITTGANHIDDRCAMRCIDASNFRAYLSIDGKTGQDGGEVQEWSSTDGGGTWSELTDITSNSIWDHNEPQTVINCASDLQVLGCYGDAEPSYVWGYGSALAFRSFETFAYTNQGHGQEIYTYGGGTVLHTNNLLYISTPATSSYQKNVSVSSALPTAVRYQKVRFNPYSPGNNYRYWPLTFLWSKTGLTSGTNCAVQLSWNYGGLQCYRTLLGGGGGTNTVLTVTTPVADTWYICELRLSGAIIAVKVVKEKDGTVIYNGNVPSTNFSTNVLYASFGQYTGATPGALTTIIGYWDDWEIR